mmetsp:Transcript_33864/g.73397  ORF Transcript_33864/g.73397 Transcript_33864/m.73397 type:complete len:301 (+) Transcript_33864:140-1042(+)
MRGSGSVIAATSARLILAGLWVRPCSAFVVSPPVLVGCGCCVSRSINMSAREEDGTATCTRKILVRILALHGKGDTGPSFARALEPLELSLAERISMTPDLNNVCFQFDYPSAPYRLGDDDEGGRAWWTLAPGERSFTAKEYVGYDESASMIEERLFTGDGFDIVLGHSQGAILLSALLCTGTFTDDQTKQLRLPIGFIFNGAAVPNPFKERLDVVKFPLEPTSKQESLFIIGKRDAINPPAGAEQVRDSLQRGGLSVETLAHSGGHSVPVRDGEALDSITDWIIEAVQDKVSAQAQAID